MKYPIGFVVALSREAQTLKNGAKPTKSPIPINEQSKLIISGMGYERAYAASQTLIDSGCQHLISWGCCAALNAELAIGDIVFPKRIHYSANKYYDLDTWSLPVQDTSLAIHSDVIYAHTDELLNDKSDKTRLADTTQSIAADMESWAVVEAAKANNIPCSVIRAVSDAYNTKIPFEITQHINEYGALKIPAFFLALIQRPFSIKELLILGNGFDKAMKHLSIIKKHI